MNAGDQCPPSTKSSHSDHSAPLPLFGVLFMIIAGFSGFFALIVFSIAIQKDQPEKPNFDLQQVGVQYLNVSVNGPTTASVSFAIWILFTAESDDADTKYGMSTFNITYRGTPLGWATLPWFDQKDNGVKRVQTTVTVDRVILDADDLVRDALLNDRVELRIMGDVNVKMPDGLGLSRTTMVSVDCVIAISPRKQALTSKLCESNVLKV